MVDLFMEAGFTYFDTAWAYTGSEAAIRQALVERYPRESYQLATKNAAWAGGKTKESAIEQFETSLELTGAGYFDNYLLHNLPMAKWYAARFAKYLADNADNEDIFVYPRTERLVTEDGQDFYDS